MRDRSEMRPNGLIMALVLLSLPGCGPSRVEELLESARSGDLDRQRTAIRELAEHSQEALPAIPTLLDLCEHPHPDVRRLCGLALGRVARAHPAEADTESIRQIESVLTQQLTDESVAVRHTAAFALLDLFPDNEAAQHILITGMRHGDGGIIDRLTRTRPPPVWAVPTLIHILLHDDRPSLRRLSATALGQIAPNGTNVREALQNATHDENDQVRAAAAAALLGTRVRQTSSAVESA